MHPNKNLKYLLIILDMFTVWIRESHIKMERASDESIVFIDNIIICFLEPSLLSSNVLAFVPESLFYSIG